jgi:soluble lytic murein transglycosylase-like protein
MACMAWESGRSFRPDVKNMAGSGATGLIQFMPTTAAGSAPRSRRWPP